MKQVLIHKNPYIEEKAGNLLTIKASENYLPEMKINTNFNVITVPFQCLSNRESLFVVANPTPSLASKGVQVTSVVVGDLQIQIYLWSRGAAFKLKNGDPLVTLGFIETCLFKQVEPSPDVKIVGETKSVLKIDNTKQKKKRKKTKKEKVWG